MSIRNDNKYIFDLIKSLTKEEKRYIKIFAKTIAGNPPDYLLLLDWIAAQEIYDEALLKQKMAKRKLRIAAFFDMKQQLYNLIIKVLSLLNENTTIEEELLAALRVIKILYRKRLYTQALVAVDKAEEQARLFDKFFFMQRLSDWRIMIHQATSFANISEADFLSLLAAQTQIIDDVAQALRYRAWSSAINLKRKYASSRHEGTQDWVLAELQTPPPPPDLLSANLPYWQGKALLYSFLRDHENTIQCLEVLLAQMDARPAIHADADIYAVYVTTLSSILGYLSIQPQHDLFERNLARARAIDVSRLPLGRRLMFVQQEFLLALKQRDFAAVATAATRLALDLDRAKPQEIMPLHHALLNFSVATAAVYQQNWAEATMRLDKVLALREVCSPQLYNAARLLSLLVYYEKGDFLLMPYIVRAQYRSLLKEAELFPFERLMLRGLRKLSNCADTAATQKVFRQLYKKLRTLLATATEIEREPLLYFDYMYWLSERIASFRTSS
jgi:hypothetical protein